MDQFKKMVDDAAYLQDEVEALKYVIKSVPYEEKPGGKFSILEMVALIDHAQQNHFRLAIEKILTGRTQSALDQEDYRKSFSPSQIEGKSADRVLEKIIKHRAAIISMLGRVVPADLHKTVSIRGKEKNIHDLLEEMLQFERSQLRQVAERVLTISDRK
ncbi:MAG: hypothetical protein ACNA8K_09890 [Cyclonatronaceae bacterium]